MEQNCIDNTDETLMCNMTRKKAYVKEFILNDFSYVSFRTGKAYLRY